MLKSYLGQKDEVNNIIDNAAEKLRFPFSHTTFFNKARRRPLMTPQLLRLFIAAPLSQFAGDARSNGLLCEFWHICNMPTGSDVAVFENMIRESRVIQSTIKTILIAALSVSALPAIAQDRKQIFVAACPKVGENETRRGT